MAVMVLLLVMVGVVIILVMVGVVVVMVTVMVIVVVVVVTSVVLVLDVMVLNLVMGRMVNGRGAGGFIFLAKSQRDQSHQKNHKQTEQYTRDDDHSQLML